MAHKGIPAKMVPSPFKLKEIPEAANSKNAPVAQPTRVSASLGFTKINYIVSKRNWEVSFLS